MLTLLFPCALGEQCSCSSPILGAMGGPSSQLHNSGCTGRTVQSAPPLWVHWEDRTVSSITLGALGELSSQLPRSECPGRTVKSAPRTQGALVGPFSQLPHSGCIARTVQSIPQLWVYWLSGQLPHSGCAGVTDQHPEWHLRIEIWQCYTSVLRTH